jgi:hypothetical protein
VDGRYQEKEENKPANVQICVLAAFVKAGQKYKQKLYANVHQSSEAYRAKMSPIPIARST